MVERDGTPLPLCSTPGPTRREERGSARSHKPGEAGSTPAPAPSPRELRDDLERARIRQIEEHNAEVLFYDELDERMNQGLIHARLDARRIPQNEKGPAGASHASGGPAAPSPRELCRRVNDPEQLASIADLERWVEHLIAWAQAHIPSLERIRLTRREMDALRTVRRIRAPYGTEAELAKDPTYLAGIPLAVVPVAAENMFSLLKGSDIGRELIHPFPLNKERRDALQEREAAPVGAHPEREAEARREDSQGIRPGLEGEEAPLELEKARQETMSTSGGECERQGDVWGMASAATGSMEHLVSVLGQLESRLEPVMRQAQLKTGNPDDKDRPEEWLPMLACRFRTLRDMADTAGAAAAQILDRLEI